MMAIQEAVQILEEILTPYVGAHMARAAAAAAHRRKLGIDGTQVSHDQLSALVDQLAMGLRVFVGPDKTARLVQEMKGRLGVPGRPA